MDEWQDYLQQVPASWLSQFPDPASPDAVTRSDAMTLKELALSAFEKFKAGQVADGLESLADLLKQVSGFYKLVFGAAAEDDLADVEDTLANLKVFLTAEAMKDCSCVERDGSCKLKAAAVGPDGKMIDPALILALVDIILRIIAERRKNKPPVK